MMRTVLTTVAAALFITAAAPTAHATPHDSRTDFAFSQPVTIPGAVLPPGEYVFRLADPDSGRRVVQVLNRETGQSHGLFLTRPTERATVAEEPEVTLGEAPEGTARSIAAWWSPGSAIGREFVYQPGAASWEHAWHSEDTAGN